VQAIRDRILHISISPVSSFDPPLESTSFVTDTSSLADCKSDEIKKCAKQKIRPHSYWLKKNLKNIFGTFWE
jgi:hypothetical protein